MFDRTVSTIASFNFSHYITLGVFIVQRIFLRQGNVLTICAAKV